MSKSGDFFWCGQLTRRLPRGRHSNLVRRFPQQLACGADSEITIDPFAEAEEDSSEKAKPQDYIHIRIQRTFARPSERLFAAHVPPALPPPHKRYRPGHVERNSRLTQPCKQSVMDARP